MNRELARRYASFWPNAKAFIRNAPLATQCAETRRLIRKGQRCIYCRGYYYHIDSARGKSKLREFDELNLLSEFM